MFSHVTVGSRDLERAGRFYDVLLAPLPRFYVYSPRDGLRATVGKGSMVAFLASTTGAVKASWASGLANGGTDDGAPGERPHYGVGYFGAHLRDPDGNKLHIVYRGDLDPQGERPVLLRENGR